MSAQDRELKLNVLLKEYDTLRAEILLRVRSRFELLTVGGAGLGIVLKTTRHPHFEPIAGVLVAVFVLHTYFGWTIARLSKRVGAIEEQVNGVLGGEVLRWESREGSRLMRMWNRREWWAD